LAALRHRFQPPLLDGEHEARLDASRVPISHEPALAGGSPGIVSDRKPPALASDAATISVATHTISSKASCCI